MAHQFAVIGLGAFGTAMARELARHGGEVIAIDKELEPVERIKDEVAYAVRFDATDPKLLEAHEVHHVDVAIIAIGDHFESMVLIAVELMQLGVKHLIARAGSNTQRRILERLGVTEVISPEEEVAKQVARHLLNPDIIDLFQLSEDYRIVEVHAPERFLGKSLAPQYQLLVPLPQTQLEHGDTLVVLGLEKDIERLTA